MRSRSRSPIARMRGSPRSKLKETLAKQQATNRAIQDEARVAAVLAARRATRASLVCERSEGRKAEPLPASRSDGTQSPRDAGAARPMPKTPGLLFKRPAAASRARLTPGSMPEKRILCKRPAARRTAAAKRPAAGFTSLAATGARLVSALASGSRSRPRTAGAADAAAESAAAGEAELACLEEGVAAAQRAPSVDPPLFFYAAEASITLSQPQCGRWQSFGRCCRIQPRCGKGLRLGRCCRVRPRRC